MPCCPPIVLSGYQSFLAGRFHTEHAPGKAAAAATLERFVQLRLCRQKGARQRAPWRLFRHADGGVFALDEAAASFMPTEHRSALAGPISVEGAACPHCGAPTLKR